MTLTELQERRDAVAYVRACLDALHEGAEERALTEDEDRQWAEGWAYVEENESLIRRYEQVMDRAQRVSTESGDAPGIMRRVEIFDGTEVKSLGREAIRDRALKVLEDRSFVRHLDTAQVDRVSDLIGSQSDNIDGSQIAQRLLITEDPAYKSAFQRVMAGPQAVLNADESRAMRAWQEFRTMNEGTTTAGGFGIPVLIDPTIILTAQGHPNDFFRVCRVETITTNRWLGVSSAGVTWSFDAEGTEVSDDSPTLAQPRVDVYTARGFIPYTIEVGQDYPGFATEMGRLLASGYSELTVQKFTVGSGSGEPDGIVTKLDATTGSEVLATTSGQLGAVDVYALWAALPIRYRSAAKFMSSVSMENHVRQFGTTTAQSDFTVNLSSQEIPSLFGHEYLLNDYMASFTGTTGHVNYMVVGDWSNYLIAQRAGMTVELVPHLFGVTTGRPLGERGWFAYARVGGDVVNTSGFRLLNQT